MSFVLLCGCNGQQSSEGSFGESKTDSKAESSSQVVPETAISEERDTLHLYLTGAEYISAEHSSLISASHHHPLDLVCDTEYGCYFHAEYRQMVNGDPWCLDTIFYADRETGTRLPLCPRPNCLHDGNIYCTATTPAYQPERLLPYEGYLYTTAKRSVQEGSHYLAEEGDPYVLRYAADGTEITEVAKFNLKSLSKQNVKEFSCDPIIHRGYLFTAFQNYNTKSIDEGDNRYKTLKSGGVEIWCCELATGKTTCLFESYPEDLSTGSVLYYAPQRLFAEGDYLYFSMQGNTGQGNAFSPELKQGFWRMSLKSGNLDFIDKHDIRTVENGNVFYYSYNKQKASITDLYRLELDTKQVTSLGSLPDNSWSLLLADDDYLYDLVSVGIDNQTLARLCTLYIKKYDGTIVQEIDLGRQRLNNTAIANGRFYVVFYDELPEPDVARGDTEIVVRYTDLSALQEGKVDWQLAYYPYVDTDAYYEWAKEE